MFSLRPCAVGSRDVRHKQIGHGVEGDVVHLPAFPDRIAPFYRPFEGQEERFLVSFSLVQSES
jgi:hypothetical protein